MHVRPVGVPQRPSKFEFVETAGSMHMNPLFARSIVTGAIEEEEEEEEVEEKESGGGGCIATSESPEGNKTYL